MSVEVAVCTPPFLDLTFVGLDALPSPGEERHSSDLLRSPGGGAISTIGLARLGVSSALAQPLGDDPPGRFVARELAREGVEHRVEPMTRTPVTVVLGIDRDRAMISYDPPVDELDWPDARITIAGLERAQEAPEGTALYVTVGDAEARRHAGRPPAVVERARVLFVNEREAGLLAGTDDSADALARLSDLTETVVITRASKGAQAVIEGRAFDVYAIESGPPLDTTGAGDLLCAAWAWADLRGAEPEGRLRWAVLAASLSVTRHTGAAGAVAESDLLMEGVRRGLDPPQVAARTGS